MGALRAIGLFASWASSAVPFGAVGLIAGSSPFFSASPVSDDNSDSDMVVSFGVTLGLFKGLKKLLIFALLGGALFFFDEGALAFSAFWHGPEPTCFFKVPARIRSLVYPRRASPTIYHLLQMRSTAEYHSCGAVKWNRIRCRRQSDHNLMSCRGSEQHDR